MRALLFERNVHYMQFGATRGALKAQSTLFLNRDLCEIFQQKLTFLEQQLMVWSPHCFN
jgi:hypothetical protein